MGKIIQLLLSTFQPHLVSINQNQKRISQHNPNNTSLANTKLVSGSTQTYSSNTNHHQQQSFTITRNESETPPIPTTETSGFSLVKGYVKTHKRPQSAEMVILASWRKTTKSRYATVLKRWENFCCRRKTDPFQPHVNDIIEFLTEIYNLGIGYMSVWMGQTALNTIVMLPWFPNISEHPLIKRFIKGVFKTKPPKPRYTYTWDINKVLSYIANVGCN